MRAVAIVSAAQSHHVAQEERRNEVEMLMPVLAEVKANLDFTQADIDFTCSGSTDYLAGQAFSFVSTLDGVGPMPPISESHVEMDGAWALYEAWVKIQTGAADTALVYSYGKSSPGNLPRVLSRQLDPYYYGPLWPTSIDLAALQGRALLDTGRTSEDEWAEIAAARRASALANPHATVTEPMDATEALAGDYLVAPLRRSDCAPISDGTVAVILAAEDRARELAARSGQPRPAWIRGIDHRIDAHALGTRDLSDAPSARLAAEKADVAGGRVDVAELHAPFTPQEVILRDALGLPDACDINPSGGPLGANPVMAAGLIRIVEAAARISSGDAERAVAHATSGPCLQQNLVCVLEGGA